MTKIFTGNKTQENPEIKFPMKTVSITFTFPPDAVRAATHSTLLPKDWVKVWCLEPKHADMPVPYGVEKLVIDFPRGGTLRDEGAILGMREAFLQAQKKFDADCVVKIDSDCACFRPLAWTVPIEVAGVDFVYIRRFVAENRLHANGCCYAMSRRAIDYLGQHFYPNGLKPEHRGHEDLIFSYYFNEICHDLVHCQIDKRKVCWTAMPYFGKDAFCTHLGYLPLKKSNELVNKILRAKGAPELADQSGYEKAIREYIAKEPARGVVPERREQ